jgi:hypothetical protein
MSLGSEHIPREGAFFITVSVLFDDDLATSADRARLKRELFHKELDLRANGWIS